MVEQRRYNCGEGVAQEFIARLSNLRHEEFWIVLLNNANNEIARYKISSGGITSTIVDSRIILKYAIENLATNLVLIHNHPSGNLNPSRDDLNLTRNIIDCCKPFKISVLDHIIIGNKKYLSFSDEGLLI